MPLDVRRPRGPGPMSRVRIDELKGEHRVGREDKVITEEPLEIRIAEPGTSPRRISVTMRTPGHDFELAAGWLFHEAVLDSQDDIETVAYCTDAELTPEQEFNVVTVSLRGPARVDPTPRFEGLTGGSSACGVCGTQSIDRVFASLWPRLTNASDRDPVSWDVVRGLPDQLRDNQLLFDVTGGVHAAALFDLGGGFVALREDVGRHNAVDKVVGSQLLAGLPCTDRVLMVSGRIGFEIVEKALASGVNALVAVGAPTSLAVDLARRADLTMVGWTRAERGVVYSGGRGLTS